MYRKGQHTVTSTPRVNSISHPNVKTALYKTKREPINLVKPQYRIIIIIIIVIITIIII